MTNPTSAQTTSSTFVDLDNARYEDQSQVMAQIVSADHCPFCEENLTKYHQQPILKKTKFWLVTPNQWPYEHTKLHLLAIYRQHATNLAQLDPQAGQELLQIWQDIAREHNVPGGGWIMRFGDTNYSAGSVAHIHAQFIVPDLEDPTYEPIRVKIGKSNK